MKTNTYLRCSLLIPFLVWGVSLLIFILVGMFSSAELTNGESTGGVNVLFLFVAFYLFGIIVWIFPYILLALTLFFWSFISQARTALKVFALSPIAMTVLTIAVLNIISLGTSEQSTLYSSPGIIDQALISLNIMGAAFALIWGYICVGIGYGIYRLLQSRQFIRDGTNMAVPVAMNQPV